MPLDTSAAQAILAAARANPDVIWQMGMPLNRNGTLNTKRIWRTNTLTTPIAAMALRRLTGTRSCNVRIRAGQSPMRSTVDRLAINSLTKTTIRPGLKAVQRSDAIPWSC